MPSYHSTKSKSSKQDDTMFDVYDIQYDVQLAANIITARMKRGVTQRALAEKMNMVQPAIARAESGNTPPSHKLLKKIARALEAKIVPPNFELENAPLMLSFGTTVAKTYSDSSQMFTVTQARPEIFPVSAAAYSGSGALV